MIDLRSSMRAFFIVACMSMACAQDSKANLINVENPSTGVVTQPGTASSCSGDLFPFKAVVNFDAKFSITYNSTFKIVTNNQVNPPKTYVLYQRGCPKPVGVVADATIPIPVTAVSVRSSTFVKFIEILGERSTIFGLNGLYSSSPCLNQRFVNKQTVDTSAVIYNQTASTPGFVLVQAVFTSPYDLSSKNGPNIVVVSSDYEVTWQAGAEWAKFIAAFYNQEASVNTLNTNSRARWVCASNRALVSLQNSTKKLALWVTLVPITFAGTQYGFSFGTCTPKSKHCDLLTSAGLNVLDGSTFKGDSKNFSQVSDWAQNVEYLFIADQSCSSKGITTVDSCDTYWKDFLQKLNGIKAVQNKQVYDVGRVQTPNGGTEYFSAVVEPDVLLADVVNITTSGAAAGTGHNLVFLRNMFTEGTGNIKRCDQFPTAVGCLPSQTTLASQCDGLGGVGSVSPSLAAASGSIACPSSGPTSSAPADFPISSVWLSTLLLQVAAFSMAACRSSADS